MSDIVPQYIFHCRTAHRGGVKVAGWTGSEDSGSIPGIHSPHDVGPLIARRLKTFSDVPVPVSG